MDRIEQEIELLRNLVPDLGASEDGRWVLVSSYRLPSRWSPSTTEVGIHFRAGYEQCGLYGIYTRPGLKCEGQQPNNYALASGVPFEGDWWVFSWELDGWQAHADLHKGSNVVNWFNGIAERFRQGV